ncbi:MAG: hypothetical protein IT488_09530 [Gammaproteobacteria bacterium]|nr:hypothetical protein [Gammaproteobacteria bacterium]
MTKSHHEMSGQPENINIYRGAIAPGRSIDELLLLAMVLCSLKREFRGKVMLAPCIGGGMGIAMRVEHT